MLVVSALKGSGLGDLIERLDQIVPNPNRMMMRSAILLDSILVERMRSRPSYKSAIQSMASKVIKPDEAADMVEFEDGRL